ncbi:uncharacterized protein ColSpa_06797 [Colletotrichum spaethianum]|uniref:Uncharacterized protein n=1 Tax=Colletotrichum spaethianum TaxID=700344 RepID=A0AA37LDG6_9PEZI|nr:uncharacterized protein ColSpa_06797 [Colletotrichum spaethianum]GKT46616.1 hypothetical protein ColSpa_06797 [Colletotrichum spaethianum]
MYPPCREQKDKAADTSRLYCASHLANPSAARYCITHKCAGADCNHPSKPASRFCGLHACLHTSCPSPRAADPLIVPASQLCAAHECRAAGCHGAARPDGSYCEDAHACAVPGCPAPRGFGPSDGATGAASVCCASHTAMIARDSAAAWGFYASSEGRSVPQPPPPPVVQMQPQAQPQRFSYLSQTEEALGQRLREERERQDQEARLDQELRAWRTSAAAARGAGVRDSRVSGISGTSGLGGVGEVGATIGLETRCKGARRERAGSHDSGFIGSPTVSDSTSSNTFVS